MYHRSSLLAALFLVALGAAAQELPVTRVVLFTSGVGYFERSGTVTGNAEIPLRLAEDELNDALKSLILRDPAGSVGIIGYPSQDPLRRSLGGFALDVSGPGGLTALLPQLRGQPLTLWTPEAVTGTLVGVDNRTEGDRSEPWLTLDTDEGLRVLPLSSVTRLKLLDPRLDQELSQALRVLAGSRDSRTRTVTAQFEGRGTRTVSLGYIGEAPVWKTTYRLDLTGDRPYLQAWAIVENTGDADWNQVRLSLVSGRPVSFIEDLYTPRHVDRPVYTPAIEAGPAPQVPEAAWSGPPPAPAPMAALAPKSAASLRDSGVQPAAATARAGELFQFTLQEPLTLARHRSALIPLTAGDVTARKVSVFRAGSDSLHPSNAVWLTNSTGMQLPAGPVTVYDGGIYAGDALTDTVLEKERRLWTYATDLAVLADLSSSDAQTTTRITVVQGVLNTRKEQTWIQTYHFVNSGATPRTLLVEHPLRLERTLVAPVPAEKTATAYRFLVDLPASGQAALAVKESRTILETQGLAGWSADQVIALVQSTGPLSASAKAALQKLADLKVKVEKAAQGVAATTRQKAEWEGSQARIRANLEAVGRDSAQGQTYLKRLMDSEAAIDGLATQLASAREAQAIAQKDLDDSLRALTVD